jgi:hypothetical protein
MDQKGKCMCGAVSYVASQVESGVHACHCSMCRQWSGGPGFSSSVSSVAFEGDHPRQTGDEFLAAMQGD